MSTSGKALRWERAADWSTDSRYVGRDASGRIVAVINRHGVPFFNSHAALWIVEGFDHEWPTLRDAKASCERRLAPPCPDAG